ncbi:mitochondrial fission ELM1 family protein [Permianibacter aggregans]|uniref:Mitochondrial fission protein ELM1 n=1 Tax=Permianibacter aggregans TaxID=1510150 RepID=A0A4R6UKV0_9GAMM|nr:ELM1/GtrOC1 family putative glycosyltransferase [Permianibacter aggregans]QGX39167.1 hypothetical protein E2H98_05610 [Permianibacter aggregans]TDQ47620.1 hypothetical protein EV696_10922 [Permianibacter aggregans]
MPVTEPIRILQISDGKRGHEVQVEGLLLALQQQRRVETQLINITQPERSLPAEFAPDIVIGAGSATHTKLLFLARRFRAKSIVLMRPKWPSFLFDACVIPAHDQPKVRDNIFISQGSLNNIREKTFADPRHGLILIGGPSKHVQWSSRAMAEKIISAVDAHPDIHWQLTTSRRTPSEFLGMLPVKPNLVAHAVDALPGDWLRSQLRQARYALVSNDSVNMVYEALTAGLAVGLLCSPELAGSRVMRGVQQLLTSGKVIDVEQSTITAQSADQQFNEADRCAQWLLTKGWFK